MSNKFIKYNVYDYVFDPILFPDEEGPFIRAVGEVEDGRVFVVLIPTTEDFLEQPPDIIEALARKTVEEMQLEDIFSPPPDAPDE